VNVDTTKPGMQSNSCDNFFRVRVNVERVNVERVNMWKQLKTKIKIRLGTSWFSYVWILFNQLFLLE
jgi:hypothetical protein